MGWIRSIPVGFSPLSFLRKKKCLRTRRMKAYVSAPVEMPEIFDEGTSVPGGVISGGFVGNQGNI